MTAPQPPASADHHPAVDLPEGVDPTSYPLGVAPLATAAVPTALPGRRFRRRPRIIAAAAITGAMALMPLSGPTALARERDRHELRVASAELFLRQKAAALEAAPAGPGGGPVTAPARGQDGAPAGRSAGDTVAPLAAPDPGGSAAEAAPAAAPASEEAPAQPEEATAPSASGETPPAPTASEETPPAPTAPTPVAAVSGIRLLVPSMETVVVGFHEAALPGSLAMASVAPLEANHNPGPMPEIAATQAQQVAPVMVLPTRARPQPPSTAMDIAVPAGEAILSPVDGAVTAVLPYTLYGQHPDVRVEIQPAGRPDLRVVMIHVTGVDVAVGDELTAGETRVAASATPFPFESQIDRFAEQLVGRALPHVHVEVRPAG